MIDVLSGYIEHFRVIEQRSTEQRAIIPVLQRLPFFHSFSDSDIARLLAYTEVETIPYGQVLLSHGNKNRELLIIVEGVVSLDSPSGIHRIYGPGDCVGEMGFIHSTAEKYRAHSRSSLKVLRISNTTLSAMPSKLHLDYYKRISDTLVSRMARQQATFEPDFKL